MKPGARPDNSTKYYEAWNRPDSGISQIQAMKPENQPDNILNSPKYYEAWNRPDIGISQILTKVQAMKPRSDRIVS